MVSSPEILHAKVLIVDDLEANVYLLKTSLTMAGFTFVQSTMDSRQVCEMHRQNHYDLIVLDLQMPRMDGFQVMDGLREIELDSYLPVLVITGQADLKLRALKEGAKDFLSKPLDLAEVVVRVHNMLEVRLLHQESKRLYAQVVAEQKVSERLLLNVLPPAIAERLKGHPEVTAGGFTDVIADSFPEVTVLFADLVGFTKLSAGVSPERLVVILNEIFTAFDEIADQHGLEKIKTIGDTYMAAAGLTIPAKDHAERAAHMSIDMLEVMERITSQRGYPLQVRIGMDTGAVVAGVIGKRKFIYDVWGDAVNMASRMESHGLPGRVQVTVSTQLRLGSPFLLEPRGGVEIKGKGEMQTWFVGRPNRNGRLVGSAATRTDDVEML